jgi:hypothetical protein
MLLIKFWFFVFSSTNFFFHVKLTKRKKTKPFINYVTINFSHTFSDLVVTNFFNPITFFDPLTIKIVVTKLVIYLNVNIRSPFEN